MSRELIRQALASAKEAFGESSRFIGKLVGYMVGLGVLHMVVTVFYAKYCIPSSWWDLTMAWTSIGTPACNGATQLMAVIHQIGSSWWVGVVALVVSALKGMNKEPRIQIE